MDYGLFQLRITNNMTEEKEFSIENRVRDLRKQKKLSQEELALALGISRQSIISLETGKTLPSLPLAVAICQFFDSAFEEMFEFEREIDEVIKSNIKIINSVSPRNIDPFDKLRVNSEHGRTIETESEKETKMELQPWRPFREAVSLHDAMDRLFEDSFITPANLGGGMPKIDIKDTGKAIVIKAELPGVDEEDISIEILDNVMTISGEKKEEKEESDEKKGYYYKESHSGAFSRSFNLPADVKAEDAVADMKKGILVVTVPKIEPKKAKKIEIKKVSKQ